MSQVHGITESHIWKGSPIFYSNICKNFKKNSPMRARSEWILGTGIHSDVEKEQLFL